DVALFIYADVSDTSVAGGDQVGGGLVGPLNLVRDDFGDDGVRSRTDAVEEHERCGVRDRRNVPSAVVVGSKYDPVDVALQRGLDRALFRVGGVCDGNGDEDVPGFSCCRLRSASEPGEEGIIGPCIADQ